MNGLDLLGAERASSSSEPTTLAPLSSQSAGMLSPNAAAEMRQSAIVAMKRWASQRVPYIWGGHTATHGFDCAGAVVAAWIAAKIVPERVRGKFAADDLARSLKSISRSDLDIGDLVFYGSWWRGVSHVMMYAGEEIVIGATGGGPKTKTVSDARDRDARVKAVSLDYRSDIRGFGQAPVGADLKHVPPSKLKWWVGGIGLVALGGAGLWVGGIRPRTVRGWLS